MPYCPTCSNPTQDQWKICAVCGNPLTQVLNTEQLKTQKPGLKSGVLISIIIGSLVLVFGGVTAFTILGSRPIVNEVKPAETSQTTDESEEPTSSTEAERVVAQLVTENICTSVWSEQDYAQAPSLDIGVEYWQSGDVRVCQVDRTSNSTTRWVTVISGQPLLQKFGPGWKVEPLSIAIHGDKWTVVTNTIIKGDPVRDDPVVQSVLIKLGGTYSLPSK